MAFTYTPEAPTDITRVRFHLGDRTEATAWFSDEEIQFAIDEEGSYQQAVITLLGSIIAELGREPDLRADWLQVNWGGNLARLQAALAEKRQKFGIAARRGTSVATYRSDSLQTEAPEDW